MSWPFRNWVVRKKKDIFTTDDIFRLKGNIFSLCLFLTSKNASMES